MIVATQQPANDWVDSLPPLRGRISRNADLAKITWFRVGGRAEVMFRAADIEDLQGFLAAKPAAVPVTLIGVGSNLLVRDGGVPGVVIRLGREFALVEADGTTISAGAAALDINVARTALEAGLAGLEFLPGVPGTVGGALRMNAGAYGRETRDILLRARAVDPAGRLHELDNSAMGFDYRHCGVPEDWIFTGADFAGEPGDAAEIGKRMADIGASRADSQPVRSRTGGSTFRNPPGAKAWQLIDTAGCRGLTVGGAMVSEQHCNFLINTGGATATDIEALGEEIRRRVHETHGVDLQWEIRRVGVTARGSDS